MLCWALYAQRKVPLGALTLLHSTAAVILPYILQFHPLPSLWMKGLLMKSVNLLKLNSDFEDKPDNMDLQQRPCQLEFLCSLGM